MVGIIRMSDVVFNFTDDTIVKVFVSKNNVNIKIVSPSSQLELNLPSIHFDYFYRKIKSTNRSIVTKKMYLKKKQEVKQNGEGQMDSES